MNDNLHYYYKEWINNSNRIIKTDICIYGGTSSGIIAAEAAVKMNKEVIICNPGKYSGGMTASGLGYTDFGNKSVIGGLTRNFYKRAGKYYNQEEAWKFEPKIASYVFTEIIKENNIELINFQYLKSVNLKENKVESITFTSGLKVYAKIFIDSTYEGDLMARSGVSFTIGREANTLYKENYNGVQLHDKHQFDCDISPYKIDGDPSSGLLPFISDKPLKEIGSGDNLIQAYNFRICMTNNHENLKPFIQPKNYNPENYELCARWLKKTKLAIFHKFDLIIKDKTDTNNNGAFSTDFIGENYGFPDGSYEERENIFQKHLNYQMGLHYFMANDERVPSHIRNEYSKWGLSKDEFVETGNWPFQLYIREARRMISEVVINENFCLGRFNCDDSVGMAAYQIDSHNCQRLIVNGFVRNEGDVQVRLDAPYSIPYKSIVPKRNECNNLLVPICISASHISYGSIRMEPVLMILGESAGVIASIAIDKNMSLDKIPYKVIKDKLLDNGQVLYSDVKNIEAINPV